MIYNSIKMCHYEKKIKKICVFRIYTQYIIFLLCSNTYTPVCDNNDKKEWKFQKSRYIVVKCAHIILKHSWIVSYVDFGPISTVYGQVSVTTTAKKKHTHCVAMFFNFHGLGTCRWRLGENTVSAQIFESL